MIKFSYTLERDINMTNVSFGAKFKISPSAYGNPYALEKEGFTKQLQEKLSTNLDLITPKKYTLVLTHRDDMTKEDTFALRSNHNENIETLASINVKMFSPKNLTPAKLADIFNVLYLKAKHNRQEARLEQKLAKLKNDNAKELNEKMKILNINI